MRIAVLALMLVLAGCESDEDRLNRLQLESSTAYLTVLILEQRIEATERFGWDTAALLDSLRVAQDRQLLAERDLNEFLNP